MTTEEKQALREYVERWKTLGPQLEAIRRQDILRTDQQQAIASLDSAIDYAVHCMPPRPTSGLIEMQRLFAKLRARANE